MAKSYSKINLYLKIFGKNSGFHMLDTALAYLDLYDDIEIKKSDKFEVNISGDYARFVDEKNNIFTNIVKYFQENFTIKDNVKINLVKNIPVGGGLAGGSGNAAKLILYFNDEYDLGLSFEDLHEISYEFGSDIAFFFQGKAAIIKNRGDVIYQTKRFDDKGVVLIIPDFGLSTKDVFTNVNGKYSDEIDLNELKNKEFDDLLKYGNDLFEIAANLKPELREIYDYAKDLDGVSYVNMSGAGSTMFAIAKDNKIDEIENKLKEKFIKYKILKSKIRYEK